MTTEELGLEKGAKILGLKADSNAYKGGTNNVLFQANSSGGKDKTLDNILDPTSMKVVGGKNSFKMRDKLSKAQEQLKTSTNETQTPKKTEQSSAKEVAEEVIVELTEEEEKEQTKNATMAEEKLSKWEQSSPRTRSDRADEFVHTNTTLLDPKFREALNRQKAAREQSILEQQK